MSEQNSLTINGLSISSAAAARIAEVLKDKPEGTFLRVEVVPGGCQGYNVKFTIDDHFDTDEDLAFSAFEQKVVCDKTSLEVIEGSTVEYSSSLMGNFFWLNVTNAKNKCSCGSSFSK